MLKSAGSSGITVKELSSKLKVKPGNIFSWFYTTGKKVSGLKKVGEAKYAYCVVRLFRSNLDLERRRIRPARNFVRLCYEWDVAFSPTAPVDLD